MKISADALAERLAREIGADSVSADPAVVRGYSVDGREPSLLCQVFGVEPLGAILRLCAEAGAAVVPWGGGTLMSLGNIPRRVDVVVVLDKLSRLIEHDDANLTATVEAGMTAAAFRRALGDRRQFLPLDPPRPERATLGGLAAANINGPRRLLYGGMRDLVIGMKMVLASGERVKTGGKVVKNVAGYDLAKLFIGSLGTLGIITELTFRVSPLPEVAASFVATGTLDGCLRFTDDVSASPLLPAALALAGDSGHPREWRAVAWIEGFEEAVARHVCDLEAMAARNRLSAHILRAAPHESLWQEVCGFGWEGDGILCRLTLPIAATGKVISGLAGLDGERTTRFVAHQGSGTVWALLEATAPGLYGRLAAAARECGGHAMIASAPPIGKKGLDIWGDFPSGLPLMRKIKHQFDPTGILNPGRFIGTL